MYCVCISHLKCMGHAEPLWDRPVSSQRTTCSIVGAAWLSPLSEMRVSPKLPCCGEARHQIPGWKQPPSFDLPHLWDFNEASQAGEMGEWRAPSISGGRERRCVSPRQLALPNSGRADCWRSHGKREARARRSTLCRILISHPPLDILYTGRRIRITAKHYKL